MTQESRNSKSPGEKLELLLKKLAVLEDMMLIGNKVYAKEQAPQKTNALLQGKVTIEKQDVAAGEAKAPRAGS